MRGHNEEPDIEKDLQELQEKCLSCIKSLEKKLGLDNPEKKKLYEEYKLDLFMASIEDRPPKFNPNTFDMDIQSYLKDLLSLQRNIEAAQDNIKELRQRYMDATPETPISSLLSRDMKENNSKIARKVLENFYVVCRKAEQLSAGDIALEELKRFTKDVSLKMILITVASAVVLGATLPGAGLVLLGSLLGAMAFIGKVDQFIPKEEDKVAPSSLKKVTQKSLHYFDKHKVFSKPKHVLEIENIRRRGAEVKEKHSNNAASTTGHTHPRKR